MLLLGEGGLNVEEAGGGVKRCPFTDPPADHIQGEGKL